MKKIVWILHFPISKNDDIFFIAAEITEWKDTVENHENHANYAPPPKLQYNYQAGGGGEEVRWIKN